MNRKQTFTVSEHFYDALRDYRYLLERNYPQKGIVKLTGDHYRLPAAERVLLYRGVVTAGKIKARQKVKTDRIAPGSNIYIDGFNVVRTVGSYLNGNFVFVGMDGFLRDVSELHRKKLRREILERSVLLLLDYLETLQPENVTLYFDKPISHSGNMVVLVNGQMKERNLRGSAVPVYSPDHVLKEVERGCICSADSAIIDAAKVPVFDMPQAILRQRFGVEFFSLEGFV